MTTITTTIKGGGPGPVRSPRTVAWDPFEAMQTARAARAQAKAKRDEERAARRAAAKDGDTR